MISLSFSIYDQHKHMTHAWWMQNWQSRWLENVKGRTVFVSLCKIMRGLVFHFLSGVESKMENEAHRNFSQAGNRMVEIEVVITPNHIDKNIKKNCLHHFRSIYFNKFTWFRSFAAIQIFQLYFNAEFDWRVASKSTHSHRIRIVEYFPL